MEMERMERNLKAFIERSVDNYSQYTLNNEETPSWSNFRPLNNNKYSVDDSSEDDEGAQPMSMAEKLFATPRNLRQLKTGLKKNSSLSKNKKITRLSTTCSDSDLLIDSFDNSNWNELKEAYESMKFQVSWKKT